MTEIWKKVNANTELKFDIEISNLGKLRKVLDGKYYDYNTYVNSRGYMNTLLYTRDNGRKNFTLHRLLMLTFVGGGEGLVINHKDGNRLNNSLDNLEWVTRSQNCKHTKSIVQYKRLKDFTEEDIKTILTEYMKFDINLNDLSVKHNVTRETMRTIINVRAKKILTVEEYSNIRNIYLEV